MTTSTALTGFHCGDRVRLQYDNRHTGTVQAVHGIYVRVQWDGTTWISDEYLSDLEKL